MTTRADFTQDEWDRLIQLPRWVVAAASAAQHDLAYRTTIEVEAGFVASASGRDIGNAFVTDVANATMRIYDNAATMASIEFTDRDAAIGEVLERVRAVNQSLKAKATVGDAMAYRQWLLAITDVVISAARTGDFLGFGGQLVTSLERGFRDRLALTLQS